jgi:chromosome partitioning protein
MPVVVAFVSQKGGVGKSTLARALATFAVAHGLRTKLADLDVQQPFGKAAGQETG